VSNLARASSLLNVATALVVAAWITWENSPDGKSNVRTSPSWSRIAGLDARWGAVAAKSPGVRGRPRRRASGANLLLGHRQPLGVDQWRV